MPLITRNITNVGDPLCAAGGAPLADVRIDFVLVDVAGKPCDAWDAVSHERVAPIKRTVVTDANGEFTVSLWPNSRGSAATQYLCMTHVQGVANFRAAISEGGSPLSWVEFMANGTPLTPQELSALALHVADDTVHLVPSPANAGKVPRINALGTGVEYVEDVGGGGTIDGGSANSVYGGTTDIDGGNA